MPSNVESSTPAEPDELLVRFLEPNEADQLVELVRESYGDSYDAAWVYEPDAIRERILSAKLRSTIGQDPSGMVLGHMALMQDDHSDNVLHAGLAVVRDSARGHHLFERMKRYGAAWAKDAGYRGIFSEATAAHPYSQKANIALGAHETGFLLGYIPASVTNNAAGENQGHRQSVALFYLRLNGGETRPMFVPEKYEGICADIIAQSQLTAHLERANNTADIAESSVIDVEIVADHNIAIITVIEPGADLVVRLNSERMSLLTRTQVDAVYADFPLEDPRTQKIIDESDTELNFVFAGIFPNRDRHGDLLRLQTFGAVDLHLADIAIGSDHGRRLLTFIEAQISNSPV